MSDEYQRLRALLLQFPDFQKSYQDYTAHEQNLLGLVSASHIAADRSYLETKIPPIAARCNMSEEDRFVFLTPFDEGQFVFLPLMAVDIDFTIAWPMVSIHLLLYGLQKGFRDAQHLKCFGYRYDKPTARIGDHNYFHLQFTHGHVRGAKNPNIDGWISRKDPSIPVDATNSVELFLSAVVSLRNRIKPRRAYFDEWSQAGVPMHALLAPMAMERWNVRPTAGGGA